MKQHLGTVGRLMTLRYLVHRFAFVLMVIASLAVMMFGKVEPASGEKIRRYSQDIIVPILNILSRPASAMANLFDAFHDLVAIRADNVRLRAENDKLRHWQTLARDLANENSALKSQMHYIPEKPLSFISARVVGDIGGSFSHTMLINAGTLDGVHKGQAVISGEMLVGRIAETGQHSARMLLLTDINSRVPVLVEDSRDKAIMAGDNSDRPRLNYLSPGNAANIGDRVVTSGHGGVFPQGIPVGVVMAAQDGSVRVEPFVHRHHIEYVTIVEYGLQGILPSDQSEEGNGK